ncbi:hypothetical protein TorRG33x02_263390 [Trema orientale]|uniref:Uncharacterized protein n=1 Tax=Trema orientale TaxID=63057 RepID=A0A2P5D3N8_TREOI|nr:hypothetical protein TorRG33x02_263390 [Trema orientale]
MDHQPIYAICQKENPQMLQIPNFFSPFSLLSHVNQPVANPLFCRPPQPSPGTRPSRTSSPLTNESTLVHSTTCCVASREGEATEVASIAPKLRPNHSRSSCFTTFGHRPPQFSTSQAFPKQGQSLHCH